MLKRTSLHNETKMIYFICLEFWSYIFQNLLSRASWVFHDKNDSARSDKSKNGVPLSVFPCVNLFTFQQQESVALIGDYMQKFEL